MKYKIKLLILFGLFMSPMALFAQASNAIVVGTCGTSTYTAGKLSPVTMSTNGNVCVTSTGGVASTVNIGEVGGNPVGDSLPVSAIPDSSSTGNITAQDVGSSTTTGANNQPFITGSPTAGSVYSVAVNSNQTAKFIVTGTWTGTLSIEQSFDGGTTYTPIGIHQSGTKITTTTFTGNFIGGNNISGADHVRVRATAAWTGTAAVEIVISQAQNSIYVANSNAFSSTAMATTHSAVTITTGGTFQQVAASSRNRNSVEVQNICLVAGKCSTTNNNCYVYFGTTGSASSDNPIILPPGAYYLRSSGYIPSDAIQVTCDVTSDKIWVNVQ